jgi:hypothetical protein
VVEMTCAEDLSRRWLLRSGARGWGRGWRWPVGWVVIVVSDLRLDTRGGEG